MCFLFSSIIHRRFLLEVSYKSNYSTFPYQYDSSTLKRILRIFNLIWSLTTSYILYQATGMLVMNKCINESSKQLIHKSINDQSCKPKSSWWQNYLLHVCMLTFHTFTLEFSLWEFSVCSSVHWNSQKSVYYC